MIPLWNKRLIIDNDVCGSSPHFKHGGYGECRTVVADGAVVDPERFAAIIGQCDTTELTPPSRLGAIHKIEYARPVKPAKPFETEDVAVEHYLVIDKLARKESKPLDEFEEAQDLPYREAA